MPCFGIYREQINKSPSTKPNDFCPTKTAVHPSNLKPDNRPDQEKRKEGVLDGGPIPKSFCRFDPETKSKVEDETEEPG
jgi:hypothetical protein